MTPPTGPWPKPTTAQKDPTVTDTPDFKALADAHRGTDPHPVDCEVCRYVTAHTKEPR